MNNNFEVALTKCFFCHGDHDLVLNTRLSPGAARQVKEMHGKVINMDPCSKCKDIMSKCIVFITIDDSKSEIGWNRPPRDSEGWMPNPYRTGGWFGIKESAVERMLPPDIYKWAAKHRFLFVEHQEAENMGLFEQAKNMPDNTYVT